MYIKKKVRFRTSDDDQARHGEKTVQEKIPELSSFSWVHSTANRTRLILATYNTIQYKTM